MDEILCLACNKTLEIPQYIDTDNYDGQIKCKKCKTLLYVKLTKGIVQKYRIVEKFKPEAKPISVVEIHKHKSGQPFRQIK
jgi:hypothetical protein